MSILVQQRALEGGEGAQEGPPVVVRGAAGELLLGGTACPTLRV